MNTRVKSLLRTIVLGVICLMGIVSIVQAQSADAVNMTPGELWDEFMHYTLIGQWELAQGYGQALINAQPDPVLILQLAESDRYPNVYRTLARMQQNTPLADIAAEVLKIIEQGRYNVRSDRQRITEEVNRLHGTTRARMLALKRLQDSGEWAIPVMIDVLRDPARKEEYADVQWAMAQIGKPAVNPLVAALQGTDELNLKLVILEALAKTGYEQALPYMQEIREMPDAPVSLKASSAAAMETIAREQTETGTSAAELFEQLARDYYTLAPSLAVPENQERATVWFWNPEKGLVYEQTPRGAFDELMAMRACENALRLNANLPNAVSLWLSSFFRLEAEGFSQPGYFGANHADAATYALTAGPEYLHRSLRRALENRHRPLALAIIHVLQRNSGQQSLLFELQAHQPLIDALLYPDREVRYSAALALASALPNRVFPKSERVTPILAEALRQKGQTNALLAMPDDNRCNELAARLAEVGGFQEVIRGTNYGVAVQQSDSIAGIDFIILGYGINSPDAKRALELQAENFRLAFVPTVILADGGDLARARDLQGASPFVDVLLSETPVEEILAARDRILERNHAETFQADKAQQYAVQAVESLWRLALVRQDILNVKDAESALIAATKDTRSNIRPLAVETIARIDGADSQRTLADMSLDANLSIEIRLHCLENLAVSAKAFGNMLSSEQIDGLYTIINDLQAPPELRNMSAQAYGSFNLPSPCISRMILDQVRAEK